MEENAQEVTGEQPQVEVVEEGKESAPQENTEEKSTEEQAQVEVVEEGKDDN